MDFEIQNDGSEQLLAKFIGGVENMLADAGHVLPTAMVFPSGGGEPHFVFGDSPFDASAQEEFKKAVSKTCLDVNAYMLFLVVELQATREAKVGTIIVTEVATRALMVRVDHVSRGSHVFAAEIKTKDKATTLGYWSSAPVFSDRFAGLLSPSA